MSFRPRDSFDRSRRPSGASGGGAGGAAGTARTTGGDFSRSTGPVFAGVSSTRSCTALTGRARLRSGLACFATLSHSSASSRVSARLRRDMGGGSRLRGRFIGDDDSAGDALNGAACRISRPRVQQLQAQSSGEPRATARPERGARLLRRELSAQLEQSLLARQGESVPQAALSMQRSCWHRPAAP